MRTRGAGGENLYDAAEDVERAEQKLAMICYLVDHDPEDIDSLRIDYTSVKLRQLWRYSSDIRGSLEGAYSNNSVPRFLAKINVKMTNLARESYWDYKLAKAVRDGQ